MQRGVLRARRRFLRDVRRGVLVSRGRDHHGLPTLYDIAPGQHVARRVRVRAGLHGRRGQRRELRAVRGGELQGRGGAGGVQRVPERGGVARGQHERVELRRVSRSRR